MLVRMKAAFKRDFLPYRDFINARWFYGELEKQLVIIEGGGKAKERRNAALNVLALYWIVSCTFDEVANEADLDLRRAFYNDVDLLLQTKLVTMDDVELWDYRRDTLADDQWRRVMAASVVMRGLETEGHFTSKSVSGEQAEQILHPSGHASEIEQFLTSLPISR